jgi:hypothetical protein
MQQRECAAMDEIIGLFPVPFMRVPVALGPELVNGLVRHFAAAACAPTMPRPPVAY